MEKQKIKLQSQLNNYSVKSNSDVSVKFTFTEQELSQALQFSLMLGKTVKLAVLIATEKIVLGEFNIYKISIDKNANTTIEFRSNVDYCFVEKISFAYVLTNSNDEEEQETGIILIAIEK